MFDLSPIPLLIAALIALVVFGPKRLPELARSAGRGMRSLRDAISGEDKPEALTAQAETREPGAS